MISRSECLVGSVPIRRDRVAAHKHSRATVFTREASYSLQILITESAPYLQTAASEVDLGPRVNPVHSLDTACGTAKHLAGASVSDCLAAFAVTFGLLCLLASCSDLQILQKLVTALLATNDFEDWCYHE